MITCIVIDDDKTIVSLFSEILGYMGVKVLAHGYNGNDAVTLYKEHHPEIVFTDIMMPEYDGFYAVEQIKQLEPMAKIVAVTADSTLETKKKLDKLAVSAIVYKPFSQDEIKDVLKKEFKINFPDN